MGDLAVNSGRVPQGRAGVLIDGMSTDGSFFKAVMITNELKGSFVHLIQSIPLPLP